MRAARREASGALVVSAAGQHRSQRLRGIAPKFPFSSLRPQNLDVGSFTLRRTFALVHPQAAAFVLCSRTARMLCQSLLMQWQAFSSPVFWKTISSVRFVPVALPPQQQRQQQQQQQQLGAAALLAAGPLSAAASHPRTARLARYSETVLYRYRNLCWTAAPVCVDAPPAVVAKYLGVAKPPTRKSRPAGQGRHVCSLGCRASSSVAGLFETE